jgi:di/tricarboxylate transporter
LVTQPQIYIFAILGTLLILLIWGRLRFDVVAFTALLLGVLAGVVPPARAFAGFGHPATITVAAVLVLSRVLSQSGAVDPAARALRPLEIWRTAHIAGLAGLGAVLSAFMNNVGTLGLLMPVALQSARRLKRPAGLLLMPLSFGTILGGLITMIGTPPNIIIATFRTQVAGEPFTMFDFAPVGLVTAVAGIGFVALVGWRCMAPRMASRAIFSISRAIRPSCWCRKTVRKSARLWPSWTMQPASWTSSSSISSAARSAFPVRSWIRS